MHLFTMLNWGFVVQRDGGILMHHWLFTGRV